MLKEMFSRILLPKLEFTTVELPRNLHRRDLKIGKGNGIVFENKVIIPDDGYRGVCVYGNWYNVFDNTSEEKRRGDSPHAVIKDETYSYLLAVYEDIHTKGKHGSRIDDIRVVYHGPKQIKQ